MSLQYGFHELKPTPVFDHPLLRIVEPIKSPFLNDSSELSNEIFVPENDVKNVNDANVLNGAEFVDPLGASENRNSAMKIRNRATSSSNNIKSSDTHHLNNIDTFNGSPLCNTQESSDEPDPMPLHFTSWRELRVKILLEFRTTERLSIESSFLSPPNELMASGVQKKQRSIIGNTTEILLKFCDLSQDDYMRKFGELRIIFYKLWQQEKRIDCIRLITEVAQTLSTISVPQFYPSQFVYVTDFLDEFGLLVYSRLWTRAETERKHAGIRAPLSRDFSIVDVLEHTRITARNWFGKVGEIRELIPRIYVECALLRCMRFMDPDAIASNLTRLCALACHCQHPLIASYARSYICRVALRVDYVNRAPSWKCLNDWLQTYTYQPAFLLWPAMQYIIECVAQGASTYEDLSPLWEYCRLAEKRPIVLCAMLNGVSHFYLAEHALEACKLVTGSEHVTGDEICALGVNLLKAQVAQTHRKPILRAVWKCVMRLASLKAYVQCCDVWMEFVTRYFTVNELEIILENLMRKLLPEKKFELYYGHLLSILEKILIGANVDLIDVLALDSFFQFLSLFRESEVRRKSATLVLNALTARHAVGSITDLTLAYQIKDICKLLNDGLTVFSSVDEQEKDSILICRSLDRVNLSEDPEQSLTYYVACRAALLNNDSLVQYVITRIFTIGLNVIRNVRYTTARSTFVYACLANLFITIPSLADPIDQLRWHVSSAQLALNAMAFLQLDEFVKFSLNVIEEITPADVEFPRLQTELLNFVGLLWHSSNLNCNETLTVFSRILCTIKSWQFPRAGHEARLLLDCLQFLFAKIDRIKLLSTNRFDIDAFQLSKLSALSLNDNFHDSKYRVDALTQDLILKASDRLAQILKTVQFSVSERNQLLANLSNLVEGRILPQSLQDIIVMKSN